jgi:trigger factor
LSTVETKDACTREITVEVPADIVAQETERVLGQYQKMARLPGFRRGKVPAGVIRQRFAEDLKTEVVEHLVPRYFRQEVERQGLVPVSQPRVTDMHLGDGEPLRFKASFEILPPLEVSGYQELRAEKKDVTVEEREVEAAFERLREQQAAYDPVEGRSLVDGDFAQVSFTGTPREAGGKGVQMDDVLVEIGGSNTLPEFTKNLRGASAGDERTFEVSYPNEFSDRRLAGRTFSYAVTVKAIKRKTLPALDDAFAKSLGEFETLDALKQRLREGMQREKQQQAEHEAKEKLVDELLRRNDFPVPESLIDRQVDLRLERGLRALAAQGMKADDMKKMDLNRLRSGQREAAVREVKASLVLEKIADAEKIEVGDDEIEKEIEALATQTQQTSEAIRARLTREGALDRIRNRIRTEKVLDFLYRRSA